ncbi:Autotransporter beta-domain-containing protein [Bradyrhizobium sp. NFR13]|uniref:autotransporter outer membrane beta-barrel domain-containing protein n=1 Tax=Bradyrhizobium sp. NFR13 TaxID=1566285 RepID=UPI0008EA092A|nr:autotransporter outer membrane beta-barrel domain-containing protein [Bradyrhizobium sp. NFR13]SFL30170.1 Autotransporter beta-domain-containing protein [Bradyrhizobium sp. NFR13]
MWEWRNGASRLAMGVAVAALFAPMAAEAQTFTVPAGTTDTVTKTLSGTQTGTVDATGTLRSTSGTATIGWNGASTGVVVTNSGVIENTSTGRVIDATGATAGRTFTFLNNVGAIVRSTQNDVFRFNLAMTSGTIVIDNAGLIQAGGSGYAALGQALDFRGMTGAASMTIVNRATGVIESLTDDAIRPGVNAVINNFGIIRSFGANTSGGANGTSDGIDTGGNLGVVVNNQAGGLISGARHGITADTDVTVNNAAGGTILGRNGSGVGSDGAGTVTNYGRITGTYAGVGNIFNSDGIAQINGDGDGVDIDNLGTIINYGIIEGTGAGGFDSGGRANASEGISIGGGTITNFGTISGTNTGIVVNKDTNVDRSGVAATTIINNLGGTIVGLNGYAIRLENKTGTAIDNDTIVNRGTIIGNGAIPDPNAIVLMNTGVADPNSVGTLNGVTYTGTGSARFIRGDGSAIQMGEGNDVLTNYGTIIGNNGRAVNMEGGNDTVNIMKGSRIVGLVDGGVGTDTLNYNKAGLTDAKRAALQAGQTVNIGGTVYTSFEVITGTSSSFASFASAGSLGVASLFDNLPATATSGSIVNLLDSVASAADVGAALAQLTPAAYQGLGRMTMNDAFQTTSLVGQHLTQNRLGGLGTDMSGVGNALAMFDSGMFDKNFSADRALAAVTGFPGSASSALADAGWGANAADAMAYAPVTKALPGLRPVAVAAEQGLFITSGASFAREGARTDAPGFKSNTVNVLAGYDRHITDRLVAGVFGGYALTRGDIDNVGSHTKISTGTIGGYGTYQAPGWFATAMGLYGFSDYDTTRVAVGTTNTAAFSGDHYAIRGTVGTDLRVSGWVVTPEIGLQYTRVTTDGFAERGGAAALVVGSDSSESLRSSVGARFAYDYAVNGGVLTPELRLAWLHEFSDGVRGINASFADTTLPGSFITATGSALRDRGVIGAGVSGKLAPLTVLSVNYDAIVGSNDAVAHQVMGRIRHSF